MRKGKHCVMANIFISSDWWWFLLWNETGHWIFWVLVQAKNIVLTLWINSQAMIFLPVKLYRSMGGNFSVF